MASRDHSVVVNHHRLGLRLRLGIALDKLVRLQGLVGLVGLVSLLDHSRPHIDYGLPGSSRTLGTHHVRNSLERLLDVIAWSQVNSWHSGDRDLLAQSPPGSGCVIGNHPGPHHHVLLGPRPQVARPDHVQLLRSRAWYRSLPDDERSGHPQPSRLDTLLLHLDLRHLDLSLRLLDLHWARLHHANHPGLLLSHRHPVRSGLALGRHVLGVLARLAPGGGCRVGREGRLDRARGGGGVRLVVKILRGGRLDLQLLLVLWGLQVVAVEVLGRRRAVLLLVLWLDVNLLIVGLLLLWWLRLGLGLRLRVLGRELDHGHWAARVVVVVLRGRGVVVLLASTVV